MKRIITLGLILSTPALAITNSVPAEGPDFMANVLIKTDARDADGSPVAGYCNATFVSPTELVTAAHCLAHAWLLRSKKIEIEVGRYRYRENKEGKMRRIGYATFHRVNDLDARFLLPSSVEAKLNRGGFKTQIDPNEDHARIQLSQAVDLKTLEVEPAKEATFSELQEIKRNPARYPLTAVSVNPVAYISTTDTKRKAQLNSVSWKSAWIESKSSSEVEPLDSGAPVFARWNGTWRLVAVVKGHAKSFFREWDVMSILPAR